MDKKKEAKGKSRKYLYIAVSAFSVIWIVFAQGLDGLRSFDNRWSDLRLIFPMYLSVPFTPDGDYTFLFGKYINKPADPKITVTAIDEYTVDKYGFPFKRKYYAKLIEKLNKAGVKAIGVDVMFFDQDRDDPANDAQFLAAVGKAGNVVNLFAVDSETWQIKPPIKGLAERSAYMAYPNSDISLDNDGHARHFYLFYPGRDLDFDSIEEKALTYKTLNMGKLRCSPKCDEGKVASLGMATYAIATGKPLIEYEMAYGSDAMTLNYRYPQDRPAHPGWKNPPGRMNFSTFRHISVGDILEDRLAPEEKEALKDGITLIGSTALGTYDHFPSPFSKLFPGVEIHATGMDNLKFKDSLRQVHPLYLGVVMLLLPWLAVLISRLSLKGMVTATVGVLGAMLIGDYIMLINLYAVPFITISAVFAIPAIYFIVDKGLAEGREKRWIKNSFGQYLSPKVVDLITKDPSKLSLGGEKREMTAFFMDLEGFTTMSEKLSPEELTSMLNEYLSAFTDIILKHDGTVDKYIGDCIVAFWNAPLDQKDHRKLACLSAVECQAAILRLHDELKQFTIKPRARIGVNSGPMVVGNMGSRSRLSYTVMGDSVNLASRMEGANKYFHSRIMVSEDAFADLKGDFDHRFLGSIRVVGKAIPVKVYEPFAEKGKAPADVAAMLKAYTPGVEKFYAGKYAEAAADFKAALAARPEDGPSKFYLDLSEQFAKAVPKDWEGAFVLTEK